LIASCREEDSDACAGRKTWVPLRILKAEVALKKKWPGFPPAIRNSDVVKG
jgi:hypothetical protein